MKQILFFFSAVLLCSGVSGQSVPLRTLTDSLSYAVGLDAGETFKKMPFDIDAESVSAGVKDAIGGVGGMSQEEAYAFLKDYFTRRLPEINKQKSEAYLNEVQQNNPNVCKTPSGLLYLIIEPGEEKPAGTDRIRVHYVGKLSDGTPFDSSYDRGEPLEIPLEQTIKGWAEGLMLVGKGGKIRLWIPPELAYGERGAGSAIPGNEVLFFEIELLDINPE